MAGLLAALASVLVGGSASLTVPPSGCIQPPLPAGTHSVETALGTVLQREWQCGEDKAFLTTLKGKLVEVYLLSPDDAGAERIAKEWLDSKGALPAGVELAFARFDGARRLPEVTLSLGDFSWRALPGATYRDKLDAFGRKHPGVVAVAPAVRLELPGHKMASAVVTTFIFGGAHVDPPGPSIVHLLGDNGEPLARLPVQFNGAFGGLAGGFTALPVSSDEAYLKYWGSYTGQGAKNEYAELFRVELSASPPVLKQSGLHEAANQNLDSPSCVLKGHCTKIRYALLPDEKSPADGHYVFKIVRAQINLDRHEKVLKTTEKVFGRCTYDAGEQDYHCPKLPADAVL